MEKILYSFFFLILDEDFISKYFSNSLIGRARNYFDRGLFVLQGIVALCALNERRI